MEACRAQPQDSEELLLHEEMGAGVGLRHWLDVAVAVDPGPSRTSFELRVRVYFDGESTPSIDADVSVYLNYLGYELIGTGSVSTDDFASISNELGMTGNGGWHRLLMLYENGVRVTLANVSDAGPSFIYSQLDTASVDDNPTLMILPTRLAMQADSGLALRGVNPDQDVTLHTLSGAGTLVAHFLSARSATGANLSYLERKITVALDGEGSPSIFTSGTKDWFDSCFLLRLRLALVPPGVDGLGASEEAPRWRG